MRIMKHHMDGVGNDSNDGDDDAAAAVDHAFDDDDDVNGLHMAELCSPPVSEMRFELEQ